MTEKKMNFPPKIRDKLTYRFFDENPVLLPAIRQIGNSSSSWTRKGRNSSKDDGKETEETEETVIKTATVVEEEFLLSQPTSKMLDDAMENVLISSLLNKKSYNYAKGTSVQGLCKMFIEDIVEFSGLNHLCVLDNLQVLDLEGDIWTVGRNEFPYGVVEFKGPSKKVSVVDNSYVLGQVYDYLLLIRSFYGLRSVYGIVTDYNTWRIVWISEGDNVTARQLHSSCVYRRDSPLLATAVFTFLMKINEQQTDASQVPILSSTRPYILLKGDKWTWCNMNQELTLSLLPPRSNSVEFFILQNYYGGADGQVYLACDSSGHLCVLKFLTVWDEGEFEDEELAVRNEIAVWHTLKIDSVFEKRLNGKLAIVMPYAFSCRMVNDQPSFCLSLNHWYHEDVISPLHDIDKAQADRVTFYLEALKLIEEKTPDGVLLECIELFATHSLVHLDIEWRHVALIPRFENKQLIGLTSCFIDLGRVAQANSQNEARVQMFESKNI